VNKKLTLLIDLIKEELGLYVSISFGVFLFILFFQPFPIERFDFNNRLLFVAGFAAIVFLFMIVVRVAIPWLFREYELSTQESVIPSYLCGFLILALDSVAFPFYLYYVGWVSISFYIMLKVVIICLVPPVVLRVYDLVHELKRKNGLLIIEKKLIQKQIEQYKEDFLNKSIDFVSENSTEKLSFLIADVVLIKSADNYVEIVFREGNGFQKKLLRSPLKTIEQQVKPYSNFFRCHRICIVNMHYVEKLHRSYTNHWLTLKGFPEQIPVSRQYLLKLKEIL